MDRNTAVTTWRDVCGSDMVMASGIVTGRMLEDFAKRIAAIEAEKWRAIAHRVAADANRYGCEGLKMRCTISDNGGLVSWDVDRA